MVNRLERYYVSYYNYKELKMEEKALTALINGVAKYDEIYEEANQLGITNLIDGVKQSLLEILSSNYGIDENKAKEISAIDDEQQYEATISIYIKQYDVRLNSGI